MRLDVAQGASGAPTPDKREALPVTKPAAVFVEQALSDSPAAGTGAAGGSLRFDISRYRVDGNTLLTADAISRALTRYLGRQRDFADVQRALEALQTAYQDVGYGTVQVTLPEQELEKGEVRFEVIETRVARIDVQGNEHHSARNIRNSLPSLQEGTTPNAAAIARSLRVANESPGKQAQVALRAAARDGEVDATIKVIDEHPIKRSISFDNTGNTATGSFRLGLGIQHSNLFDRDHTITFQYITNPENPSRVTVFGLGYRIPLYSRGDSLDFIAGYSNVDSGTVQQLFNVSGAGYIYAARYNHNFDRVGNLEHKLTLGYDYRIFQSNVTFVGNTTQLVPDITIRPFSATYSGVWRGEKNEASFYASYSQNLFPGGNDASASDFQRSRVDAKASYRILRAGGNYSQVVFGDWQVRAAVALQHTEDALVAGEQFGLGGGDSVRGFDERQFSNDRGHRASVEVYTPDIAGALGWTGGRMRWLAFYDTGSLTRNLRQPGEQSGLGLDSVGIGVRVATRQSFSLKADFAYVLHDAGMTGGDRSGRRHAQQLHAAMVWVF